MTDYLKGEGCTCYARNSTECACDADWTPPEVIKQDQRIKELEAHVERLRKFVINSNMISYEDEALNFYEVDVREFQELIDESPAQSLREIQADAIQALLKSDLVEFGGVLQFDDVHDYEQQLRNGGE
jgi:hypothetical protein